MNFAHLRTFVAIADHGGFGRAAARLNLTQSAASRQIQGLEAELGVKLFDRIGRGVQLTSEGEDLLRRFRRENQRAQLWMRRPQGSRVCSLRRNRSELRQRGSNSSRLRPWRPHWA